MDRLTFNRTGGFILNLQDLEFMQDGIENVIRGLCQKQMRRQDSYTWIGNAKLEGNTLTISNSLFYDQEDDELFFIENDVVYNGDFNGDIGKVYLYLDESYDEDGYKVFADGDTWPVRRYRRMKLGTLTSANDADGSWKGLTLNNLYNQRRNVEPVSYGAEPFKQDEEIYKIHRWKYKSIEEDFSFDGDDTYQEIRLLNFNEGSSNITINLPSTNYPGDSITIHNTTSSLEIDVYDGRGDLINTLSNGQGQTYYVDNYSWTESGIYTLS